MPQYIIIEGPIGSGKTYLVNQLKEKLRNYENIAFIPEYIETETGEEMLNLYLDRKINSSMFQFYILGYWDAMLNINKNKEMIIMERGPESGQCFIENIQLKEKVNEMANLIYQKYNFTKLGNFILDYPIDIEDIYQLIINSNKSQTDIRIYLNIPIIVTQCRIVKRKRRGEENYNTEYLTKVKDKLEMMCFNKTLK